MAKKPEPQIVSILDAPSERSAHQFLQLFTLPEISRRIDEGTLGTEFIGKHPDADGPGQILLPSITLVVLEDGRPARVLLNAEANVQVLARLQPGLGVGSVVPINELEIGGYLIDGLPPNAGWALMINQAGRVRMGFDFRRNGAFARQHLKQARGFVECARFAAQRKQLRVCVECLFHAVEKVCKAEMLTLPLGLRATTDNESLARKEHHDLRALYGRVGQEKQAARLMDRLQSLRRSATYHLSPFRLSGKRLRRLIADVEALQVAVRKWIPRVSDARPSVAWIGGKRVRSENRKFKRR